MHDFMRVLAQLVAGLECCMVISNNDYKIDKRCRHVMVHCGSPFAPGKFPNELLEAKKIRTLLVQSPPWYDTWNDCHKIFSSYSSLRALDFSSVNLEKLSDTIGELRHLRYLNLSSNFQIEKLPSSIAKLKNLEILDLSYCHGLLELPRNITKMVNLKDLIIKGCYALNGMPRGLRALSNLQTLSLFVAPKRNNEYYEEYGALEELCGLSSLQGQLEVKNLERLDSVGRANYIEEMQFRGFLKLRWDDNHENGSGTDRFDEVVLDSLKPHANLKGIEIENFMGVKLSSWLSSMTNLTSIALSYCKRCQYIPPLDELPSLKSLLLESLYDLEYISEKASNNCSSTSSRGFFPSLERLELLGCSKLKGWWRTYDDDGAINEKLPSFACLSILEIKYCPNLTSMPLYPSIDEVTLEETSWKALQPTMMMMNSVGQSSSSFSAALSNLKSLCLNSIDDLEYISRKAGNGCSSTSSRTFFPSLKQLNLERCYKLKGWWRRDDDDGATTRITELPSFACLSRLKISFCPYLNLMPLYPSLEELYLEGISSKLFQKIMMMKISTVRPSTSFSFSSPLFKLKSLTLREIDDLECLPEDGLRNLSSLVDMKVVSCRRLTQLSPGIRFLTSLQKMIISDCEELECLVNDEDNEGTKEA